MVKNNTIVMYSLVMDNCCASICVSNESFKRFSSGIIVCKHFVLVPSTSLLHIFKQFLSENSVVDGFRDFSSINVKLNKFLKGKKCNICVTTNYKSKSLEDLTHRNNETDINSIFPNTKFEYFFTSPSLFTELEALFSTTWRSFVNVDITDLGQNLDLFLLSSFIILKIQDGGCLDKCFREKTFFQPHTGETILINGCPFGEGQSRSVFSNSLSRGIVSNVSSKRSLFLTDARCVTGCEGAPAFKANGQSFTLCGIVLSPFYWRRGEWIGLTLVASLSPLICYVLELLNPKVSLGAPLSSPSTLKNESDNTVIPFSKSDFSTASTFIEKWTETLSSDLICDIESCLVRVMCANKRDWGTGFIINTSPGIIVTCAHVVKDIRPGQNINVILHTGETVHGVIIHTNLDEPFNADIDDLYKEVLTEDNQFVLKDVSFIKIPINPPRALPLATQLPYKGQSVLVGGFPIFNSSELSSPTFCFGIIANISFSDTEQIEYAKKGDSEYLREQINCPVASNTPTQDACLKSKKSHMNVVSCSSFQNSKRVNSSICCTPSMLQLTCSIYSGSSGSPVVTLDPKFGPTVVGMVTSVVKDEERGMSYAHVSFATPSVVILNLLRSLRLFDELEYEIFRSNFSPVSDKLNSKL